MLLNQLNDNCFSDDDLKQQFLPSHKQPHQFKKQFQHFTTVISCCIYASQIYQFKALSDSTVRWVATVVTRLHFHSSIFCHLFRAGSYQTRDADTDVERPVNGLTKLLPRLGFIFSDSQGHTLFQPPPEPLSLCVHTSLCI